MKLMKKGVSIEQVARVTKAFAEEGILVHAYTHLHSLTHTHTHTLAHIHAHAHTRMYVLLRSRTRL